METAQLEINSITQEPNAGSMSSNAKIGDVVLFNNVPHDDEVRELSSLASFASLFIEDFKQAKLPGTVFDFINRCMSTEEWLVDLEHADKIADAECEKSGISLGAIKAQARAAQREVVKQLVERVRHEYAKRNLRGSFSQLEIVDGAARIKESEIESIRKRHSVCIDNEAQLDFWEKWLEAKRLLNEIGSIAKQVHPVSPGLHQIVSLSIYSQDIHFTGWGVFDYLK